MPDVPKEPVILSDNPTDWKSLLTDPGMVTLFGFIALLLGLALMAVVPGISAIYAYFSGGVVGLVGGHAWTDSKKTQYMCDQNKGNQNDGN